MIINELKELLNAGADKVGINDELSVVFSSLPICDFQCNGAFALGKKYGKNPYELASEIVENISHGEDYVFSVAKPGFINIALTDKKLASIGNEYLCDEMGGLKKSHSGRVILDYGGANIAKALHIGHLRSPIIGEALKRLYTLLGEDVISDVHLGDWGLQMGLTELGLYEEGLLDYYFTGEGEEPKLTLDMLNEVYPKASAKKNIDENFKKKADEWTVKIQQKQEPYFTIYKKIRNVSVNQIKENYHELGACFDLWYGESDADEYIQPALKQIEERGLLRESEGAMVVDVALENENIPIPKKTPDEVQRYKNPMPPAILKKYNGGVLYATTDIATIMMRNEGGNVDRIEYIVDGRQKTHFTQVFRVCKMAGISPENQQLIHIGYGTMNGRDGKPFKTRSGDAIKLQDIIDMLVERATEKLKSNNAPCDRDTALKIGVGAMKFGDLINNVGKDYVFDLDKFLSFEGKTGPYIQYTLVRINSILAKVGEINGKIQIAGEDERSIIKSILRLNASYEICYKEKSLNALALALYELASEFSTFYNNHSVIGERDENRKAGYVALLQLVKKKLSQGLYVLGIETPAKM